VQKSFGFSSSKAATDVAANKLRYHTALHGAWYINHIITIMVLLQDFFFSAQRSIAWQLEKAICQLPQLAVAMPGRAPVLRWSEKTPRNAWSFCAMAVSTLVLKFA
jgi:hypothetical protein